MYYQVRMCMLAPAEDGEGLTYTDKEAEATIHTVYVLECYRTADGEDEGFDEVEDHDFPITQYDAARRKAEELCAQYKTDHIDEY